MYPANIILPYLSIQFVEKYELNQYFGYILLFIKPNFRDWVIMLMK